MKQILDHLIADTPILWINTHEYERAVSLIEELVKHHTEKKALVWSITNLIPEEQLNFAEKEIFEKLKDAEYSQPLAIIKFVQKKEIEMKVLILLDFHIFLSDIEVSRALLDFIEKTKKHQTFNQIVIISPVLSIPTEIEKYVTVIDLPLPSERELEEKLMEIFEANKNLLDEDFENRFIEDKRLKESIIKAGKGLTLFEFENAINLSISTKNKIDIQDIFWYKKQLIVKTAGLNVFNPEDIDEVKGLEIAKEYITKAIKSGIGKGSLLVGVPGTGKSLLAKQIGKLVNLPTITLDFGAIFGSAVGESEKKISHALKTVEAMAPCILFIDEIEKGISGINSSHFTDGGTGSRVFGKFLTWLNDKKTGIYVIATANDITKIPAEFLRSGRWNWIFFVDVPTEDEAREILKYYCEKYKIDYEDLNLTGYTGAEIKTIVENAKILQIPLKEAINTVIPISKTKQEEIQQLRKWASGRCIPASKPAKKGKIRKVSSSF